MHVVEKLPGHHRPGAAFNPPSNLIALLAEAGDIGANPQSAVTFDFGAGADSVALAGDTSFAFGIQFDIRLAFFQGEVGHYRHLGTPAFCAEPVFHLTRERLGVSIRITGDGEVRHCLTETGVAVENQIEVIGVRFFAQPEITGQFHPGQPAKCADFGFDLHKRRVPVDERLHIEFGADVHIARQFQAKGQYP